MRRKGLQKLGISIIVSGVLLGSAVTPSLAATSGLNGIGVAQPSTSQSSSSTTQSSTSSTQPVQNTSTSTQGSSTTSTQSSVTPAQNTSQAQAIGSLVSNIGVNSNVTSQATAIVAPFAQWANLAFAVILAGTSIAIFLITGLDIVYIAVPPLRGILMPGGISPQRSGDSGYNGGGYNDGRYNGGGYSGGYNGGGYNGGGYNGGGYNGGRNGGGSGGQLQEFITQLISDEAKYAVAQVTGVQNNSSPTGIFNGGYSARQEVPFSMKSVLFDYMKKRSFFLIMFGVCAVLFSVTIFTSLGIDFGSWLLDRLTSLSGSIPS